MMNLFLHSVIECKSSVFFVHLFDHYRQPNYRIL